MSARGRCRGFCETHRRSIHACLEDGAAAGHTASVRRAARDVLASKYVIGEAPPPWMKRLAKLINSARILAEAVNP